MARALEKSLKKKEAAAGSETPNKGCNMDSAMNRFTELHEMAGHCLDLGQRISEYHNGLMMQIGTNNLQNIISIRIVINLSKNPIFNLCFNLILDLLP